MTDDEVVLIEAADAGGDPVALPLRLAAVAAETEPAHRPDAPQPPRPQGPGAARPLAGRPPGHPGPGARHRAAGHPRPRGPRPAAGSSSGYLPEWAAVRNKPQRNPYHRFTVDRHLLEATANAATLAHRVSRADLLLLGTLLHDIGKGFPGDHTEVGMIVARDIATRMGFASRRRGHPRHHGPLHLLLPDSATRRDLDDPATAQRVADEVGDRRPLELLAALVEADSLATGPSAWGSWKAGLVADLVERTSRLLAGEPVAPPAPLITDELQVIMDTVRTHGVPALSIDDPTVTVVAPDRPGLLAEVTGVSGPPRSQRPVGGGGRRGRGRRRGLHGRARARGRWPAAARLVDDLAAVMAGTLAVEDQLAERARTYRNAERRPSAPQPGVHRRSPWTTTPRPRPRWSRSGPRTWSGSSTGSPGPWSTAPRRHLGQGLHLRLGGGRRLLRPRPRRQASSPTPGGSPTVERRHPRRGVGDARRRLTGGVGHLDRPQLDR